MVRPLRQALRMLLLPIRIGHDGQCGWAMAQFFKLIGIARNDIPPWVVLELEQWSDSGAPSAELMQLIRKVLISADPDDGENLANEYFEIHNRLIATHLLGHEEARSFLSHAFVIVDLARRERLSAAQIAKLFGARDGGTNFSRQSVGSVLGRLGLLPQLALPEVKKLVTSDFQNELPAFADSDPATAANIVANAAKQYGFRRNMFELLNELLPANESAGHTPYLQMLHYQCVIAEFYDHAATDLYEFTPRGLVALWLFEQYPNAEAGNPFLNNAKSVERIDSSWVRSKANSNSNANALFQILSGLEELGFAARRELAKWIRMWLCRAIRISIPNSCEIPKEVDRNKILLLAEVVQKANTETFGVFEQRIVDCIARTRHPLSEGWRERGLMDAVNTTNLSKRKLGDCDFQHSTTRQIAAYESHGGTLTQTYIREHFRTLAKALRLRMDELLGIDEIENWNLSLTFVAHSIRDMPESSTVIMGLPIKVNAITFSDFLSKLPADDVLIPAFSDLFLHPLSLSRTPVEIRRRLSEILGL